MRFVETMAGFGEAVLVTARFALVAPATISETEVLCCRLPLVALIFKVYVPGGVEEVVVTVNTDVLAFEFVMFTELGLNPPVASAESPDTLRATVPVNPPAGVTVTVYVVEFPGFTVCEGGLALTAKSAAGVVSEIFATNASLAPPALAGCNGAAVGKLLEDV